MVVMSQRIPVDQQQFVEQDPQPFWHPTTIFTKVQSHFPWPFLTHSELQLQVVFTTSTFQKVAATWLAD